MLLAVQAGVAWMWEDTERPPAFVLGVPVLAAVAVFAIRRYLGDDGHEPLTGIHVAALTPRQFVDVILAILATLLGGLVLGPEVALVSTGAVVGTVVARVTRTDAVEEVAGIGALAAILALFLVPMVSGSLTVPEFEPGSLWVSMAVAIPVGIAATVAVQAARALGWGLHRMAGAGPHLWALLLAAVVVGGGALLVREATGADVSYVVTSGEGQIRYLATETSLALVLSVLAVKVVAYAASLGSGFRGGPFFPAMFVGAAAGLALSLLLPDVLPTQAAVVTGVVAGIVATARMPWWVVLVIGAASGFAFGSWPLVPAAVVAAAVARLLPRLGDRLAP